ncbi:MAG: ABC transporter substrate-binding protein [Lautropia sp.]|nr:ABC transporter substrate-binding protein [Lautropia sp.]
MLLLSGLIAFALPAQARSIRWAAQAEVQTLDPHAQHHSQTQAVLQHVYESLTRYNGRLEIEPSLASKWEVVSPLVWRFHIRKDVRFHDGTPLDADDVLFSLERIREAKNPLSVLISSIRSVRKLDSHLIEITVDKPAPLLPRHLADASIMSRSWARKHNAEKAQNHKRAEQGHSARHANGTGPFRVDGWPTDKPLHLTRNPDWWDSANFRGNISAFTYVPIGSDTARMRALLDDEVDIVTDLPSNQAAALRRKNPHLSYASLVAPRTLMIGMDQSSTRLRHGNAGNTNPFRDQQVRLAMYLALDMRRLYRATEGTTLPAGTIVAPGVTGWTAELDRRPARDLGLARQLMQKAGYADGFDVTLDCPNNRYAYDTAICEALVPMLKPIGIRVTVNSQPFASLMPRLETLDSSMWLLGWGSPDNDALHNLLSLTYTHSEKVPGTYNAARISNRGLDALIDAARVENRPEKRRKLLEQALQIVKDQVYYLPLRHATRTWVMNRRLKLLQLPAERPDMRFIETGTDRSPPEKQ